MRHQCHERKEGIGNGSETARRSREKPTTGIVLAVGEGKLDKDGNKVPVPVKKGDKVIFGKYGGTEVNYDGEDVLILRADDIYAICE